jgi:hypothetical protein
LGDNRAPDLSRMTIPAKRPLFAAATGALSIYVAQAGGKLAGKVLGVCLAVDNPLVAVSLGTLGAEVGRAIALGALVIIGAYWLVDSLVQLCCDRQRSR